MQFLDFDEYAKMVKDASDEFFKREHASRPSPPGITATSKTVKEYAASLEKYEEYCKQQNAAARKFERTKDAIVKKFKEDLFNELWRGDAWKKGNDGLLNALFFRAWGNSGDTDNRFRYTALEFEEFFNLFQTHAPEILGLKPK